jgi:pyruvate formate lyase activating enzyme
MSLQQSLDPLTADSRLALSHEDGSVTCLACAHRCLVKPGRRGICQVRFNEGGALKAPWGYVAGLQSDPIEKKPFFHVLPGADALTFGMLGCDLHCPYCQNWISSQALRDPACEALGLQPSLVSPQKVAALALQQGVSLVVSSYNEPLVTAEWSAAIFKEATAAGLKCAFVSNGNCTPEVLEYLRPYLSAYKVDLKTMSDKNYRRLGAVLQNVLDSIRRIHEMGLWLEVVTLVVPGFNDSPEELWDTARFLAGLSPDIPWHVTAFHPDYQMDGPDQRPTPVETLLRAAEIGREAGLRYVYAGNLPGRSEEYENTYCHACRKLLIARYGYTILDYQITAQGACPACGAHIAGLWTDRPERVRRRGLGRPRRVGV